MKNYFYLFSLILLISSCKSKEILVQDNTYQIESFIIGQGGGITGEYIEYEVFSNGTVHLMNWNNQEHEYYKSLDMDVAKNIFKQLNVIDWIGVDYVSPGNLTSYVAIKKSDNTLHRVVWEFDKAPQEDIKTFFQDTYPLLK